MNDKSEIEKEKLSLYVLEQNDEFDIEAAMQQSLADDMNNKLHNHIVIRAFIKKQDPHLLPHEVNDTIFLSPKEHDSFTHLKELVNKEELEVVSFHPSDVAGDGNCFFRSLCLSNIDFETRSKNGDLLSRRLSFHLYQNYNYCVYYSNESTCEYYHQKYDYLRKSLVEDASIRYFGNYYHPKPMNSDGTFKVRPKKDTPSYIKNPNPKQCEFEFDTFFRNIINNKTFIQYFEVYRIDFKSRFINFLDYTYINTNHVDEYVTVLMLLIYKVNVIIFSNCASQAFNPIRLLIDFQIITADELYQYLGTDSIPTINVLSHNGKFPLDPPAGFEESNHYLYLHKVKTSNRIKTIYAPFDSFASQNINIQLLDEESFSHKVMHEIDILLKGMF